MFLKLKSFLTELRLTLCPPPTPKEWKVIQSPTGNTNLEETVVADKLTYNEAHKFAAQKNMEAYHEPIWIYTPRHQSYKLR